MQADKAVKTELLLLSLGASLLSCSTSSPSQAISSMCESAAYVTAKKTVLARPETREDFQSTADLIDVVLSDWNGTELPTVYDLRQALSWMYLRELRSSKGAVIITDSTVLLEMGKEQPVEVPEELVGMVASSVRSGLVKFLEIKRKVKYGKHRSVSSQPSR